MLVVTCQRKTGGEERDHREEPEGVGSGQLEGEKDRQSIGAGDQGPCREEQSGGGEGKEKGTGLLGNLGCCCEVGDNLSWSPGKDRSGHCPSIPGQTHLHVLKTPESL